MNSNKTETLIETQKPITETKEELVNLFKEEEVMTTDEILNSKHFIGNPYMNMYFSNDSKQKLDFIEENYSIINCLPLLLEVRHLKERLSFLESERLILLESIKGRTNQN